jgi:hypothetical protein
VNPSVRGHRYQELVGAFAKRYGKARYHAEVLFTLVYRDGPIPARIETAPEGGEG